VIAGWDEGCRHMKVGGNGTLIIPPARGYGRPRRGRGDSDQRHAMVDVELLDGRARRALASAKIYREQR